GGYSMFKIFSVLFLSLMLFGIAHGSNTYVVTFSVVDFSSNYTNFSYVMQIDDLGNVTSPPKKIHNINWGPRPELTAVAQHNSSDVNVWINFVEGNVQHGNITTADLTSSKLTKLPIAFTGESFNFQTTSAGKFLASVKSNLTAQAYGVGANGLATG